MGEWAKILSYLLVIILRIDDFSVQMMSKINQDLPKYENMFFIA